MRSIQLGFRLCRPARADNAQRFVIALGIDHKDQSSIDRTDGNEPIFFIRVRIVEYFQVLVSHEEDSRLLERDTMLLSIRAALGVIPDEPHASRIGQRPTKSMAYSDRGQRLQRLD